MLLPAALQARYCHLVIRAGGGDAGARAAAEECGLSVGADTLYLLGALAYVAASLRDAGCFRACPTAGRCVLGIDSRAMYDDC